MRSFIKILLLLVLSKYAYGNVSISKEKDNAILADNGFNNSLVNNVDELQLLNEEVMNEVEIAFEEGGITPFILKYFLKLACLPIWNITSSLKYIIHNKNTSSNCKSNDNN